MVDKIEFLIDNPQDIQLDIRLCARREITLSQANIGRSTLDETFCLTCKITYKLYFCNEQSTLLLSQPNGKLWRSYSQGIPAKDVELEVFFLFYYLSEFERSYYFHSKI